MTAKKSPGRKSPSPNRRSRGPEDLSKKIYHDEEGYVAFPDGSRYNGDLEKGIPEG